jgi:hypothetical protein
MSEFISMSIAIKPFSSISFCCEQTLKRRKLVFGRPTDIKLSGP